MRQILSALLVLTAAFAQTPAAKKKSFLDKPTLESYVRHLFVWPPQITVAVSDPKPTGIEGMLEVSVTGSLGGASQVANFFVSKNGEKVIQGQSFDVKENPFKATIDKLKAELGPAIGTSGAPVVVTIFSDFQCPYCKEEGKMLRANLIQTYSKEVRAYFKDFPLEQIHNWAKPASMAGRCVFREDQAKFWDFHDWVFDKQDQLKLEDFRAKFEGFLNDKKLNAPNVLKCFDSKATEDDVNRSFNLGRAVEVTSTPTIFVNGRKLAGNVSWPQLKQIIDYEIEYQKTAKNAGEDCGCDITLPSPLPK
jgi:protein-disulfide isomerase